MKQKTLYIIGGPTASGKSARALELAAQKNGVIINADSMQVYDALPILTAQPSAEEKRAAPHELYGFMAPNKNCSAGSWRGMAIEKIHGILAAGKTPIIVGGSGLYLKALMEGFSPVPNIPDMVRQAAIDTQLKLGNPGFHAELEKRDPEMARRFHPMHTARLVRAWEVLEATGKSLAEWQRLPKQPPPAEWRFDITVMKPGRDTLDARCDTRFVWMMENGAVEEMRAHDEELKSGEIHPQALINKALGARPLLAYVRGICSKEDAIQKAQLETRQYAKRQMTWFRNQVKKQDNIDIIRIVG